MKVPATAAALLACLGACLALDCGERKSFSAATFDAVNFAPGVSYHDVPNGIILYENLLDDLKTLWVRDADLFYVQGADGSCAKSDTPIGKIESVELLSSYVDRAGVSRTGLADVSERLVMRFLVNDATCFTEFTLNTNTNGFTWSFVHSDHKELTDADKAYVQAALQKFEEAECSPLNV
ncbi:hypothetical protein EGW08_008462 [Elysia chlorotica]|uniref:Lipocalin/cytosolic fatty-acid binding domain-containing protein n=1 Tax=Elysia chlorotica TaxID=188477 RepID=A0A3S0ZR04_ELYCH|nr:hypothetical protein EGW08_008462 [Elysia chlorotica]